MRMTTCPNCRAKVSQTDTHCMDCGVDLVAARNDIVKQAARNAPTVAKPASGAAALGNPAAAGIVAPGESAEEKRLRVFDQQQATELRKQRPAIAVTALLSLAAAVGLAATTKGYLLKAGGFAGLKTLTYGQFKALGFGVVGEPRVTAIICAGLALAAFLCFIGEALRLLAVSSAIAAVSRNEIPNVVGIAGSTMVGLVIAAFFCPPLGIIVGVLLKLSKDPDTSSLGTTMIYAGLLSAGVVVVNTIWNLAGANLKTATPAKEPAVSWLMGLARLV
jgi:hypothetical protein